MPSQVKRSTDEAFFKAPREHAARDSHGFPIGPRTKLRQAANRELNKLEINHCEAPIEGRCVRNKMLTWSHPRKSRFMVTKRDFEEAARQCLPCHDYCENNMSHKERAAFIRTAIAKRKP